MSDRRWADLAAAYALDALDPEEHASFEEELARNSDLRDLVDEYREASASLAFVLEPTTPPDGLKERVLARARRVRGAESEARRSPWPVRVAAAAAILIAVGIGAYSLELRDRMQRLEAEQAQLQADLILARAAEARLDSLVATLSGPDIRTATLAAPDTDPNMRLIWNRNRGTLLLAGASLPPAPPGRTYQLWGIDEGEDPVSLGTFDSAPDGTILTLLDPGVDDGFDLSAVTEEPAGGSPQPTTPPFLVGNWSAEPS